MPSLSFRLDGSVALVTGGTSGIGLAIAEALLDAGAKVVVGSRGEEKVRSAEQYLKTGRAEGSVVAVILDVADRAQIASAVETAVTSFGRLDILVNCAGANVKRPTLEVTEEEHRRIFDINYFGPFNASQLFAQQVIKQGPAPANTGGYSIVNVCSVTSFLAMVESTAYASSKSALLGMTRQLAVEWPRLYGIRVNGIAPGFVPADQNRKILQQGSRGRRVIEHTPMERFGVPEEIAGSVVYICSQAGRFLNGECINIDGGFISTAVCEAEFRPEALDALAEAAKQ